MLTVDRVALDKIIRDLYLSTNIQSVLFDPKGRVICEYPKTMTEFCRTVRTVPQYQEKCFACDRHGFSEAAARKQTYIYRCHMGLTECVAPIVKNDTIIGYLMLGQGVSIQNIDNILHCIQTFPMEEKRDLLKSQLTKMEPFTDERLSAVANVAQMCTSYLWLKELITVRQNPIVHAIEDYLENHLCEDLSVGTISTLFGISKTSLYLLWKDAFGMGINTYIRQLRMERAKRLLTENNGISISDVSLAVGYLDSNYFARVFKQYTGSTPLQWRKVKNN